MGVRVGADSVINSSFSFADMLVQQVSLSALHMLQRGNTFKAPNLLDLMETLDLFFRRACYH